MLYLLDADTLITGDRLAYPIGQFRPFWEWLIAEGAAGRIKIPREQYDEIVVGTGDLVDWLKDSATREALLLDEEADMSMVGRVILEGYGGLDETGIEAVGRDPFLVSYALAAPGQRTVVTFEVSKPSRVGTRRKLPDVCTDLEVPCCNLYRLVRDLGFSL